MSVLFQRLSCEYYDLPFKWHRLGEFPTYFGTALLNIYRSTLLSSIWGAFRLPRGRYRRTFFFFFQRNNMPWSQISRFDVFKLDSIYMVLHILHPRSDTSTPKLIDSFRASRNIAMLKILLPARWSVTRRSCSAKGFIFTCAVKRDAQVVFCKGFYFFFGISHSPRTPLGHSHRWSICKHYVDKLQRFSPKCHNIFILTMPTALGWRYRAVYGEKSPKTRLVRIYCYGNTLYIVNLSTW